MIRECCRLRLICSILMEKFFVLVVSVESWHLIARLAQRSSRVDLSLHRRLINSCVSDWRETGFDHCRAGFDSLSQRMIGDFRLHLMLFHHCLPSLKIYRPWMAQMLVIFQPSQGSQMIVYLTKSINHSLACSSLVFLSYPRRYGVFGSLLALQTMGTAPSRSVANFISVFHSQSYSACSIYFPCFYYWQSDFHLANLVWTYDVS